MGSISDISRMNLADLEKKGSSAVSLEEEAWTDDEILDADLSEVRTVAEDSPSEALEEPAEPKKMAEPVGQYYKVDTMVEAEHLGNFMLSYTYRSPLMIAASIFSVIYFIYVLFFSKNSIMLAGIAFLVICIFYPVSIKSRGKAMKKKLAIYENTFHYMFDEVGLHLELGEDALDLDWNRVTKVISGRKELYIYTGKTNAFIIPKESMGAQAGEIEQFIKEHSKRK